jgi:hypothetical protein
LSGDFMKVVGREEGNLVRKQHKKGKIEEREP